MDDKKRKKTVAKGLVMTLISLVLTSGTLAGTYAYFTAQSKDVVNNLSVGEVTTEVAESFDGTVKSDVCVKNTGSVSCYVRAAVLVYFSDADGKILAKAPQAGKDYSISFNENGWFLASDGYWYCKEAVAPGEASAVLINLCEALSVPEGYTFEVKITASGLQSVPDRAVIQMWPEVCPMEDGRLKEAL